MFEEMPIEDLKVHAQSLLFRSDQYKLMLDECAILIIRAIEAIDHRCPSLVSDMEQWLFELPRSVEILK